MSEAHESLLPHYPGAAEKLFGLLIRLIHQSSAREQIGYSWKKKETGLSSCQTSQPHLDNVVAKIHAPLT